MVFSCTEEEVCDQKVRSVLYAKFKKVHAGAEEDTTLNNVTLYGLGNENMIYDSTNNLSQIGMLLNPELNVSSFIIKLDSIYDTMSFYYQHELIFISYPCGFSAIFTIDSSICTTNKIDSLILTDPIIDPESEETYNIFL